MAVETGTYQVVMPAMGDSVAEGTVLEWHKHEGDAVAADETLVEISTDKVDAEVPVPAAGTLVKIYIAEGEDVAVGAPLAEIALADGVEVPVATEPTKSDDGASGAPAGTGSPAQAKAEDSAAAQIVDIITPGGGESVSEGTILTWTVKVGEPVKEGDTVVEVSTDKVDMELPAPASGTITEILFAEGETVSVGQVIARMSTDTAAAVQAPSPSATSTGAPAGAPTAPATTGIAATTPSVGAASTAAVNATPVARRVAAAEGVDLAGVDGSARGGRVTKADVLAAAARPALPAGAQRIKGGAAALARYMNESRSVPTATSFRMITVTTLDARRKQLKAAGQRVSFTHLIAYAIARAVADEMPTMADHFLEQDGAPYRVSDGAVNLGLAVDVEKKDGSRTLMVPVIRDAAGLDFAGFVAAYNALVEKARTNTLAAGDLTGGNVSLTNPGGLGTVASVPRLMSGQGTIVATGAIGYPKGLERVGERLGIEKVMMITSTYDHRVIQGAASGEFLAIVEGYLQGAHDFYEQVFGSIGLALPPLPAPPEPTLVQAAGAGATAGMPTEELLQAVQAAMSLVEAYRTHGHLAALLDPLGRKPEGDPALDPKAVGLSPQMMAQIPSRILQINVPGETLADSLPHLREIYCGSTAYEIEHISSHRQRLWLRKAIESGTYRQPLTADESKAILGRLTKVDSLERFLHRTYIGQKQFSMEGIDMTVPMLDEIIKLAAQAGAREVVIGMAHRGRLNVLAHSLGRPYGSLFAEFEGHATLAAITTMPDGGTGDVKYHHGARGTYPLANGDSIIVRLESNPSHLEFVDPVATGATRAAQTTRQGQHANQQTSSAVPVLIHGDAAFPGQGVVAETLNLHSLDGYTVGGTVHLIQDNQIGFTTEPDDARSTLYSSDLAKGFDIPIIHVNADDVAACISAVRLAAAYREEFGHDVLIDLIGYRRFGHNEADEPAYTQPEMYQIIKKHPRVRELYSRQLVAAGVVTEEQSKALEDEAWSVLATEHRKLKERIATSEPVFSTGEYVLDRSRSPEVHTAVELEELRVLNQNLLAVPDGFTVHPKLVKQLESRRDAFAPERGPINWAHGEALAFASLLTEGIPVRLTGQDAERGTFSNRHLVLHDAKTGQEFCAIQHLPGAKAPMELHNSPLSESACLGFELGYSQEAPETLVLWEAQFGDFANGAQVMIDQFIASGLAKWGQTTRLTLLLPHGYEGQGPEHSSARLERYLQLAAEGNMRIANCTTPAQYFHLLRRQARIAKPRPLILMTPKSLLRLPQAASRIEDLTEGSFQSVIPEADADNEQIKRLVLCSGKIYYDILGYEHRDEHADVAVARVELLYPFPESEIRELIASYPNLEEIVWVQEEPRNMGARAFMSLRLRQILPSSLHFGYIGRVERAATGEGYPVAHAHEQNRIVRTALDASHPATHFPKRMPGSR
jgi:2-oxoglutarate dehydrogenase E1 component